VGQGHEQRSLRPWAERRGGARGQGPRL